MIEKINSLARTFTDLTGYRIRESYLMQCEAREWLEAGFTEDDLKVVVWRIKKTVESERIRQSMLRWSFLIGNLVRFEEELQEAKATKRNHRPAPTNREKVLAVTGRAGDHIGDSNKMVGRTPAQVMSEAGQKAFAEFCALRKTL